MNYKLLIIFIGIILLLVLLIFSLRNNFSENFEYLETKEVYRLADILRNSSICYNENNCKNYSINLNRIVNDYPNSLGAYYINNNYNERLENGKYIINNKYDLSLLVKILKTKKLLSNDSNDSNDSNNSNNYVAIHIRLGDVLCGPNKLKWVKKRSIYNPYDMIDKILNYYKDNNVLNHLPVKIYTFYHKDHWTKEFDTDNCIVKKSEEYLKIVTSELTRNNITNITIYNNRFPDDDVVDCVNAKHFISSAGNFSKLILDLRKLIY